MFRRYVNGREQLKVMAKVKPSIIEESGAIGDRVYYTRFGKTFSRLRPTTINDQKSEAQLRQRSLFKAMQHTASLLGSVIQRGPRQGNPQEWPRREQRVRQPQQAKFRL